MKCRRWEGVASSRLRPRLLMLAEHLPPHLGGVEKHIARVAEELARQGCEVTLFTIAHEEGLPEKENWKRVRVFRAKRARTRAGELREVWLWMLRHIRVLLEADIVHLHSPRILTHWYLPFRLAMPWKACFMTFHGASMRCPPRALEVWQKRLAERLTDGSILVGGFLKTWFGLRSKRITWGGVDIPVTKKKAAAEPFALFLGRLDEDTGPSGCLEAMRLVNEKREEKMEMVFAGGGKLEGRLRKRAERLPFRVRFLGFQEHPDGLLERCAILFAPGYLSILEGLARKKPIFCLAVNPMKRDYLTEIAAFADQIFVADSPQELANYIIEWLEKPPDKEEILERGFSLARKSSWRRLAQIYLKLWGAKPIPSSPESNGNE